MKKEKEKEIESLLKFYKERMIIRVMESECVLEHKEPVNDEAK